MRTCRLRSVYDPSTFRSRLSVCMSLSACHCLSVCLPHLNTCAPLMPSNVSVPLFVFQSSRSSMDVLRFAFRCARSTACPAMCAPHRMRSTGYVPRSCSQCMHSIVCDTHAIQCLHSTTCLPQYGPEFVRPTTVRISHKAWKQPTMLTNTR